MSLNKLPLVVPNMGWTGAVDSRLQHFPTASDRVMHFGTKWCYRHSMAANRLSPTCRRIPPRMLYTTVSRPFSEVHPAIECPEAQNFLSMSNYWYSGVDNHWLTCNKSPVQEYHVIATGDNLFDGDVRMNISCSTPGNFCPCFSQDYQADFAHLGMLSAAVL